MVPCDSTAGIVITRLTASIWLRQQESTQVNAVLLLGTTCHIVIPLAQIVRELKAMAQALRPPRNRAKAVAAASISSAELDARGIPSGRPKPSTTQVRIPVSLLVRFAKKPGHLRPKPFCCNLKHRYLLQHGSLR